MTKENQILNYINYILNVISNNYGVKIPATVNSMLAAFFYYIIDAKEDEKLNIINNYIDSLFMVYNEVAEKYVV